MCEEVAIQPLRKGVLHQLAYQWCWLMFFWGEGRWWARSRGGRREEGR